MGPKRRRCAAGVSPRGSAPRAPGQSTARRPRRSGATAQATGPARRIESSMSRIPPISGMQDARVLGAQAPLPGAVEDPGQGRGRPEREPEERAVRRGSSRRPRGGGARGGGPRRGPSARSPPASPSQVFFGETDGISRWRPEGLPDEPAAHVARLGGEDDPRQGPGPVRPVAGLAHEGRGGSPTHRTGTRVSAMASEAAGRGVAQVREEHRGPPRGRGGPSGPRPAARGSAGASSPTPGEGAREPTTARREVGRAAGPLRPSGRPRRPRPPRGARRSRSDGRGFPVRSWTRRTPSTRDEEERRDDEPDPDPRRASTGRGAGRPRTGSRRYLLAPARRSAARACANSASAASRSSSRKSGQGTSVT